MPHAVIVNTARCLVRQDYKDKILMKILDCYLPIVNSPQIEGHFLSLIFLLK